MIRLAIFAVVVAFPAIALADEDEDALVNCLIAKSVTEMVLSETPMLEAYQGAWIACEKEAALVSNVASDGADNSPLDGVDEHAYHTIGDIDDRLGER